MKTFGFVGISGSGKSYRAPEVAGARGIKYIIDDGLLISASRVIAGRSAKKERTRLASVRCALFFDERQAAEVKKAIDKEKPESVMILGTSHAMIEKIASALDLPKVSEFIEITDVATEEEIKRAREIRRKQGKHVIPVPTFEVKKDFSGYWMDALKKITGSSKTVQKPSEKTVVRPTFSYLGEFIISNAALVQICMYEASKVQNVAKCISCSVREKENGIDVKIDIAAKLGRNLKNIGKDVMAAVRSAVDNSTAINVNRVDVNIKTLVKETV